MDDLETRRMADAMTDLPELPRSAFAKADPVPGAALREVARALRPGGVAAVTLSTPCLPTEAVSLWQALAGPDQCRLVALHSGRAGFGHVEARQPVSGREGGPLRAVWGCAAPQPSPA